MKYFREVTARTTDPTKKNVVIMGRKTYNSISPKFRPLKGRVNIVLSRDIGEYRKEMEEELAANPTSLQIAGSLEQALQLVDPSKIEEIFIIGGAQLYNSVMNNASSLVDRILLTEIRTNKNLEMDTYFDLDTDQWEKRLESELAMYLGTKGLDGKFQLSGNTEGEFGYDFTLWSRK
ncbi:DEKNAAC105052 [Brettanomyces naardenensis]|uniref:Dihydrofolate reductase n=1 Tax=Brettanomyces naardenensis TaxID=13370 RepID=A0A448YS85_BRENA|nr:DEKNAAC105052 [Brettanomyces naardenensis]